jgi:hypothetical protein
VGVVADVGAEAVPGADAVAPLPFVLVLLLALPAPQANVPIVRPINISHSTLGCIVIFI